MRGLLQIRLSGALVACACTLAAASASAQGSYSPYDESPAAALARYVRTLASEPKDFEALIGAGKAALELGDAQAAAGFFARADEVDPRSPQPQAGMGAVSVANGEPQAALPYFKRAQQLGASVASFACDRGLAYDLLGQQAQAQADYRWRWRPRRRRGAPAPGAQPCHQRRPQRRAARRFAPLSAKGDAGVARVRAFVLALTGDSNSADDRDQRGDARAARQASRPSSSAFPPSAGQKAAAVNLGMFPIRAGLRLRGAARPSRRRHGELGPPLRYR